MKRVGILGLLAAAAIVLFLWQRGEDRPIGGADPEDPTTAPADAVTAEPATEEAARREVAIAGADREVTVRVVDDVAEGTAIAGVEVVLTPLFADEQIPEEVRRDLDARARWFDERRSRATTDASGRATAPFPSMPGHALVDSDGWFGGVRFEADVAEVQLEVRPVVDIHVRAVDHTGSPLPDLLVTARGRSSGSESKTDSDGLALLRIKNGGAGSWQIAPARWLGADPGFPVVSRSHPASRPVELRLPPFGSVRVRVVRDGPSGTERGVRVRARDRSDSEDWFGSHAVRATYDDGDHVFDRVGLARHLEVRAEAVGEDAEIRVTGPRTAGEEVLAEIEIGAAPPSIELRLMELDASPASEPRCPTRPARGSPERICDSRGYRMGSIRCGCGCSS